MAKLISQTGRAKQKARLAGTLFTLELNFLFWIALVSTHFDQPFGVEAPK